MATTDSFILEGTNNLGVLLCHSLTGSPAQMRDLAKKLNKKGYTVSCPLYDGHGLEFKDVIESDAIKWYQTLETAFDELRTQVEGIYVIGMSIGGSFAVKLATMKDVKGLVTLNAPVIGFDLMSDLFNFQKGFDMPDLMTRYKVHRQTYFNFVVELGQIEALRKITAPTFVLQGSFDLDRYKTSSHMLMTYISSEVKQRKDYSKSRHLLLRDNDKKEVIKDIVAFVTEN